MGTYVGKGRGIGTRQTPDSIKVSVKFIEILEKRRRSQGRSGYKYTPRARI